MALSHAQLDIADPGAVREARAGPPSRPRDQRRRLQRRRPGRDRPRQPPSAPTRQARASWPKPRPQSEADDPPRLDRLRLRRREGRALRRDRPAQPALGVRPEQARGREGGARGQPPALHRPHRLGLRPRREELPPHHPRPRRARARCGWWTTSAARPPTRRTWPGASRGSSRPRPSGPGTSPAGAKRAGTSSPASCSGCGGWPAPRAPVKTAEFPRPARRPRRAPLVSLRQPPIRLPTWQEGLLAFASSF